MFHCDAKCFTISLFHHFVKRIVPLVSQKMGMRNKLNVEMFHETTALFWHTSLFTKQKLTSSVSPENRKLGLMRLTQLQNNNIKNMCLVGNPVRINNEQRGVSPSLGQSWATEAMKQRSDEAMKR
jgi:hypothetical protein